MEVSERLPAFSHCAQAIPTSDARQMLSIVEGAFSDDIAVDLGTANTLVHVAGRGVVIDEPSVVAVRGEGRRREVLSVGRAAETLRSRAPERIEMIRPMRDGVIADFPATEEMLRRFLRRAKTRFGFRRPRVLICVPASATQLERRAVQEAAQAVGARKVYLVEEPVAASIGAGLTIEQPAASMVVDIGGGTTDIAVMTLGEPIKSCSLRVAGNTFDAAIADHVRRRHRLAISHANAERIKIQAGTVDPSGGDFDAEIHIRGRDLDRGGASSIVLGPTDVAEALHRPLSELVRFIESVIEELPRTVQSDLMSGGIVLTGGGALLDGLDRELSRRLRLPVRIGEEASRCVVRGTAQIFASIERRGHLLVGD